VIGIGAEGEIEADAFAAVAGAEGAGDFDGVKALAVHLDVERVDAVGGDGFVGVGAGRGARLVDADIELVVGVAVG
jgi:hypothetical protein